MDYIEKFIDHRQNTTTGRDEYLIKWENRPASENSWEPESNLNDLALEEARQFKEGRSFDYFHLFKGPFKELYLFCRYDSPDSLSEGGLREIIERHGWKPNHHLAFRRYLGYNFYGYDFFLWACRNENVNEGIIECLIKYFPHAINVREYESDEQPIHAAFRNKNVTLKMIQLLVDAAPDSIRSKCNNRNRRNLGWMPLHLLCNNKEVDETTSMDILRWLLDKCPESVRHPTDNEAYVSYGDLPIHLAAKAARSLEFCRALIEAYPGSVRMTNLLGDLPLHYACERNTLDTVEYLIKEYPGSVRMANLRGKLPLHYACERNTLDTVEYIYKLYPAAINQKAPGGYYPIHLAIHGQYNPAAVDIVKFLLDCDPNVKLQKYEGIMSLLRRACRGTTEAGVQIVKVIYDAHPEAIEDNELASDYIRGFWNGGYRVQPFINSQLVYSRQAKDRRLMATADGNGQLPLHIALQDNVRLGSIKLLVKGYPPALQFPDNSGALPLRVACLHHESASVVEHLLGLDKTALDAVDRDGNTALHYACLGAKYETIALLLDKYDAVPVSKRNAHEKLPIDLLWESNGVEDRESIEYTESIFRLLRAHPEPIVNCNAKQQAKKKRKFDDGNETGESADECSHVAVAWATIRLVAQWF